MAPTMILGLIALAAGVIILFSGLGMLKMKKLIEKTQTSKISLLKEGFSEIKGQVLSYSSKLLKAPFSGKDCVYSSYKIEQKYNDSKGHSHWKVIRQNSESVPFILKDDSGETLVMPEKAQFDVKESERASSGFMRDPPANVKKFLEENKISYEGLFGANKTMRYSEYIIEPKRTLYILGTAEKDSSDGYNGTYIIKRGKDNMLFISDREEKDLLSSYTTKMLAGLIGGGILALIGVIIIAFSAFAGYL